MPRAIIRDVGLDRQGLGIVPYGAYLVPTVDGRTLELHHDTARTCASIARFSRKDAQAYPAWEARLRDLGRRPATVSPLCLLSQSGSLAGTF